MMNGTPTVPQEDTCGRTKIPRVYELRGPVARCGTALWSIVVALLITALSVANAIAFEPASGYSPHTPIYTYGNESVTPQNGVASGTGVSATLGEANYSIEKIFYGNGWVIDTASGIRRLVALLNLTLGYTKVYPGNGTFGTFSQIFVEYSIPADASSPIDEAGLKIRFSYYVDAHCFQLNESTCPLGANSTAISQDVFELEIRRILEYRDLNANGSYEPGEAVVREVPLSQPLAPFVRAWPFALNGSRMDLTYDWSISSETENITEGALFAGEPLLDQLSNFWISVGDGVPMNLTVDSFLYLRPTTYKGIPLTPTQLKLDIHVGVPSYDAPDTALALEFALTSTRYRFSSNATATSESLYASSDAAAAFFTWNSTAEIDVGRSGPVGSTIVAVNESAMTIFLAYPRATLINHDPVLGLSWGFRAPAGPSPGNQAPVTGPPTPNDPLRWVIVVGPIGLGSGLALYTLLRRRRPRP